MAAAAFLLCMALVLYTGISGMREKLAVYSQNAGLNREVNPAEQFQTLRQQLRAMQKAQLNEIAHNAGADPDLAAMAQRQLLLLCRREEQELTLEGMLRLRGWKNPVVSVSEEAVNVLLQTEMITQAESSIILDMVCRETGIQSGNVKIIPIN